MTLLVSRGSEASERGRTIAFLGCGNLSTAILCGILSSLSPSQSNSQPYATGADDLITPTRFIACIRGPQSARRIQKATEPYTSFSVEIIQNDNIRGVQESDVIILGCKPYMLKTVLDVPGMREVLKGKLLISILAGTSEQQIEDILYPSGAVDSTPIEDRCRVVRAMPNTAAMVRESMTVIGAPSPPLQDGWGKLIDWIFTRIGRVVYLPPECMDASTALAGSGPAFMALALEGIVDGAVAMGLPRAEALIMAAQVMRGASTMALGGEHPAHIKEKISTPGGCTIGGLLVLEENAVRGSMARAVRETTVIASQLGRGLKNVNGTRY
ncbi:pyrroline-5-carboxylate reductase dimerization-domain-containing protein [Aspergillus granulosus]|uniref:Pyrroline-5-carboxylate reductase n=1 Tax=Aspergillus granulosus TaxID=176169 RepID=A0ABR4HXY6_9EURO